VRTDRSAISKSRNRRSQLRPEPAPSRDWLATARTLAEALPFLQRYDGATVVIKFGGHAMGDDAAMAEFARDIVLMKQCNVNPVVVHGGGPMINEMLARLGDQIRLRRAASASPTPRRSRWSRWCSRAGSTSASCRRSTTRAARGRAFRQGREPDGLREGSRPDDPELGFVGRPGRRSNPMCCATFLGSDFIPVVAPIGAGRDGETYNINGDTAAGAIAAAMKADRLLLLTDVAGVKDADGAVLTELSARRGAAR
jgi:acetylglutamate kinase